MTLLALVLILLGIWLWTLSPQPLWRAPVATAASAQGLPTGTLVKLVAVLALWLTIGGWWGAILGSVAAVALWQVQRLTQHQLDRVRQHELQRQAPGFAELLAASVSSGVPVDVAIKVIAEHTSGALGELLQRCVKQLDMGADQSTAWLELGQVAATAPIARALIASAQSGTPLALLLDDCAADLRIAHRQRATLAANAVVVKSVGPLGLCFLPAFVLLGVVPVVASLLTSNVGWWS